jgi:prolyl 4-hydroxylase
MRTHTQNPKMSAKLYCYLKRDKPYLKLAPIKVDIVHLNPLAVVFRDVISDYETDVIKQLATPRVGGA